MQCSIVHMVVVEENEVLAEVGLELGEHAVLVDWVAWTEVGLQRVELIY